MSTDSGTRITSPYDSEQAVGLTKTQRGNVGQLREGDFPQLMHTCNRLGGSKIAAIGESQTILSFPFSFPNLHLLVAITDLLVAEL
ncbi:unnamed protein product [Taenia asiatica]|uniref:Uncharacterized protein n=1 Tax=Taenia asiatica TaxID=60517 RepID=A0A0R3WFV3_TAEAS|nr:unnamed protein product [Taenia asiatica]